MIKSFWKKNDKQFSLAFYEDPLLGVSIKCIKSYMGSLWIEFLLEISYQEYIFFIVTLLGIFTPCNFSSKSTFYLADCFQCTGIRDIDKTVHY